LAEDHVVGRFEEALQIIVPLMRGGRANFEGTFHSAHELVQLPVGPRPNSIPLLIGAQKPRSMRLAAMNADIWSTYAEANSSVDELSPRLEAFKAVCTDLGRDFDGFGRAAGLEVAPLEEAGKRDGAICGSPAQIADSLRTFREAGFTQIDLMVDPGTVAAFDSLARVVEMVRAG
jgi:alkanesulfonate monooxygenase SsuD/methylene tetrahydromethanopterin reductase-like flavin-dependent oxidoreductase (luciferase family)